MKLETGARVDCRYRTFGELADVVIDPTTKRLTHLVVKAQRKPSVELLVPVEMVEAGDATRRTVRCGARRRRSTAFLQCRRWRTRSSRFPRPPFRAGRGG